MFPIEKYKFFRQGNKVIAVTTYAGKTVRGTAKCHESDTFDFETGKKLAAARCAVKVAQKRYDRAFAKKNTAEVAYYKARQHFDKMVDYVANAEDALYAECRTLEDLIEEITD